MSVTFPKAFQSEVSSIRVTRAMEETSEPGKTLKNGRIMQVGVATFLMLTGTHGLQQDIKVVNGDIEQSSYKMKIIDEHSDRVSFINPSIFEYTVVSQGADTSVVPLNHDLEVHPLMDHTDDVKLNPPEFIKFNASVKYFGSLSHRQLQLDEDDIDEDVDVELFNKPIFSSASETSVHYTGPMSKQLEI